MNTSHSTGAAPEPGSSSATNFPRVLLIGECRLAPRQCRRVGYGDDSFMIAGVPVTRFPWTDAVSVVSHDPS